MPRATLRTIGVFGLAVVVLAGCASGSTREERPQWPSESRLAVPSAVQARAVLQTLPAAQTRPETRPEGQRRTIPAPIRTWLARDGRIAHRGGSADWPEMSRYAYDRALKSGYRALEISLARTADGVWFGLHDTSLDRTSGTTDLKASTSTWAEVQQLRINAVASDRGRPADQPYLTLTEFLDAYYGKAVLFIDVKRAAQYADELIAILDALPGDAARSVVAKHVWRHGSSTWLDTAHAHGYTTWRAFRPHHDFGNNHRGADMLGMSYKASPRTWAAITAIGKPVIAHVVPDRTAARAAMRKGAVALMVSGVTELRR